MQYYINITEYSININFDFSMKLTLVSTCQAVYDGNCCIEKRRSVIQAAVFSSIKQEVVNEGACGGREQVR